MKTTSGLTCRSCAQPGIQSVLDLGRHPLANQLLRPEELAQPEPRFPLQLAVCPFCWLMQITETVPPEKLFGNYLYFSSFSDTMLEHSRNAAKRYIREYHLNSQSLVCEIASNDGYLLQNFHNIGIPCLGIEPAENVAEISRKKGIPTEAVFFSKNMADRLVSNGTRADLLLGNNVFAHVPEINDFVSGLAALLKPGGRIVLEFPYGGSLLKYTEFDTIYHEHVFYFCLTPLISLFARAGLDIHDVEKISIHGGSLRIFASHRKSFKISDNVRQFLAMEEEEGLTSIDRYLAFSPQVEALKFHLMEILRSNQQAGMRIAAYGASAKGSTLLNTLGIGQDLLDYVVDRSTYKQGLFTPGSRLPIYPSERLASDKPDLTLLLTWNFAEEILEQQYEYLQSGGKFIIPLPELKIIQK